MPRRPRIHYPGAIYHVIVKGNNGENVFLKPEQKNKYIRLLTQYKEKYGFLLYAYCVMNSHAHLLARVREESLSRIMQGLQQTYTQWHNRKYDRTGHVFQQRYKAFLCEKENYLLELVRYIHKNPVKAHLPGGIYYEWSSHLNYLGKDMGGIVDTADIFSLFSREKKEALKQYLHFMGQEGEDNIERLLRSEKGEMPLIVIAEEEEKKEGSRGLSLDEIIEKICLQEKVSFDAICSKTRVQKISDIRKAIILISEKYAKVSNSILAEKLALPPSMVSKVKSGACRRTEYLEYLLRDWEQQDNE